MATANDTTRQEFIDWYDTLDAQSQEYMRILIQLVAESEDGGRRLREAAARGLGIRDTLEYVWDRVA